MSDNEPSNLDYLIGSVASIIYISIDQMKSVDGSERYIEIFTQAWNEIEKRVRKAYKAEESERLMRCIANKRLNALTVCLRGCYYDAPIWSELKDILDEADFEWLFNDGKRLYE